jgi:GT2 family glycosyltransferase
LNNDIELDPQWLAEMVSALERDPNAGSAACKLLNYWRRDELDGAGDVFTRDGIPSRRGHGEPDRGQYERGEYVFAPTAGAALYRASVLESVGPFDESFFAYYEDVDWGLRAQLLGYRCCYAPTAIAYHMGSATTGGTHNRFYFQLMRRNLLAVLIKDLPLGFLIRNGPWIAWAQMLLVRESTRAGMVGAHLVALGELPRRAPRWWRARWHIMRRRKIGGLQLTLLAREWTSSGRPR